MIRDSLFFFFFLFGTRPSFVAKRFSIFLLFFLVKRFVTDWRSGDVTV